MIRRPSFQIIAGCIAILALPVLVLAGDDFNLLSTARDVSDSSKTTILAALALVFGICIVFCVRHIVRLYSKIISILETVVDNNTKSFKELSDKINSLGK